MEATRTNPDTSASPLVLFIRSLMADGRPFVSRDAPGPVDAPCLELVAELNFRCQQALCLDTPAFCKATAGWAAVVLYHSCQLIACRELGPEAIDAAFGTPCPESRCPETDWSADLFFRHLPALCRLARRLSNADPLNQKLKALTTAFPLSSVGIPDLKDLDLNSFVDHPSLRRLYADRILAADDRTRLGDPRVDELLRADLGWHRELAPGFAAQLFPPTPVSNLESKLPDTLPA